MAMTPEAALEHLKDAADCPVEAARTLAKVKKAYPEFSDRIGSVNEQIEKLRDMMKSVQADFKTAKFPKPDLGHYQGNNA